MAVLNPSFEDSSSATPFLPDQWTAAGETTSYDWAPYDSEPTERFEQNWLLNQDRLTEFNPLVDLEDAIYDTAALESVEDFEEEWSGNEARIVVFNPVGDLEDAQYDAALDGVEDFEEEWSGNEGRLTAFVGVGTDLANGVFDAALDDVEDFEEEWNGNEARIVNFTGHPTDIFDADYSEGSFNFEDFDRTNSYRILGFQIAAGSSTPTAIPPTSSHLVTIDGVVDGNYKIEARPVGTGTFVEFLDFTGPASATEVLIPAGHDQLRTTTVVYTSGSPNGNRVVWIELE